MKVIFALVTLIPFFATILGVPLEEQGLAKRRIFNYEPDLSISKRGSNDKLIPEIKREEESPDSEVKRDDLRIEVKRGDLQIEVKRGDLQIEV